MLERSERVRLSLTERARDERRNFVNLEKCSCGAYRYLAVRMLRRSLTLYLIHIKGKDRKYLNVAHVKKSMLEIHGRETES